MNNDIYRANGYNDREDYLSCLAEDYGVDLDTVKALADLLEPNNVARLIVEQANDIEALRAEVDALEAENERLRKLLKDADNEMDWLDEDIDTCDHSAGICMCSYWSLRRKMKAALAMGMGGQREVTS